MADVALVEVIDFYVDVTLPSLEVISVEVVNPADPILIDVADVGVAGPPGNGWVQMTQAEYDALPVKDPDTMYVIIG